MQISRQVILDDARKAVADALKSYQKKQDLTNSDMENILYAILVDYKSSKEAEYSSVILNLMTQIQQLEDEKKKVAQAEAMQLKEESK